MLTNNEIEIASSAKGFLPVDEGLALASAVENLSLINGDIQDYPFLEIGSYCGRSACFLGPVARNLGTVLFSVDHHRGSLEMQSGWEHHDETMIDRAGLFDSAGCFRSQIHHAGLEDCVIAVIGESTTIAKYWDRPLGYLFIDGGHSAEVAASDYHAWVDKVAPGGLLAIHDVFDDPNDGGLAPYEQIYVPALSSAKFEQVSSVGSLKILQRVTSSSEESKASSHHGA